MNFFGNYSQDSSQIYQAFSCISSEVTSYVENWCISNPRRCLELGGLLAGVEIDEPELAEWLLDNPDFTTGLVETVSVSDSSKALGRLLGVNEQDLMEAIDSGNIMSFVQSSLDGYGQQTQVLEPKIS